MVFYFGERDIHYAMSSGEFLVMFKTWEFNKYDRRLCPTVDRINPELGYILENMRWLTHSENSRLGSIHRNLIYNNKDNEKSNSPEVSNL